MKDRKSLANLINGGHIYNCLAYILRTLVLLRQEPQQVTHAFDRLLDSIDANEDIGSIDRVLVNCGVISKAAVSPSFDKRLIRQGC